MENEQIVRNDIKEKLVKNRAIAIILIVVSAVIGLEAFTGALGNLAVKLGLIQSMVTSSELVGDWYYYEKDTAKCERKLGQKEFGKATVSHEESGLVIDIINYEHHPQGGVTSRITAEVIDGFLVGNYNTSLKDGNRVNGKLRAEILKSKVICITEAEPDIHNWRGTVFIKRGTW